MFGDWKFYLFLIAILNIVVTSVSFLTIKFNDLRHLGKDVSKIQVDLEELNTKVVEVDKKQAVQEQRVKTLEEAKR